MRTASLSTSDGEKCFLEWRVHQMSTVFRTLRWRFSVVDWRPSDDGMTFKTSIYLMNDFPSSCNCHANTHGFVCHPGKSLEMIPPNYVHVQSNASVVTPWWFPCVVVVLEMCNLRSLIYLENGSNDFLAFLREVGALQGLETDRARFSKKNLIWLIFSKNW